MASRSVSKSASTRNSPLGLNQRGDRKRGRADATGTRRADARDVASARAVGGVEEGKVRTRRGQVRDQNHVTASGLGERGAKGRVDVRASLSVKPGTKKRSFESRAGRTPAKNAVSTPSRRAR